MITDTIDAQAAADSMNACSACGRKDFPYAMTQVGADFYCGNRFAAEAAGDMSAYDDAVTACRRRQDDAKASRPAAPHNTSVPAAEDAPAGTEPTGGP